MWHKAINAAKADGDFCRSPIMPLPLIPLAIGALVGGAAKKPKKVKAVSGYKTKKGKKVKAYLKKDKS